MWKLAVSHRCRKYCRSSNLANSIFLGSPPPSLNRFLAIPDHACTHNRSPETTSRGSSAWRRQAAHAYIGEECGKRERVGTLVVCVCGYVHVHVCMCVCSRMRACVREKCACARTTHPPKQLVRKRPHTQELALQTFFLSHTNARMHFRAHTHTHRTRA